LEVDKVIAIIINSLHFLEDTL